MTLLPYTKRYNDYEPDEFKLHSDSGLINGSFEKTDRVVGIQNGFEIGVFHSTDGRNYLVFDDHTAKYYKRKLWGE